MFWGELPLTRKRRLSREAEEIREAVHSSRVAAPFDNDITDTPPMTPHNTVRLPSFLAQLLLPRGESSSILRIDDIVKIDSKLPLAVQGREWKRLYCLRHDGSSLFTFYTKVKGRLPTIIVVRTNDQQVFGGFTMTPWKDNGPHYYGTGECFLFRVNQAPGHQRSVEVFRWTGLNQYNQVSSGTYVGMGGGGGEFGLLLDDDFLTGSSGPCDTFLNPPLHKPDTELGEVHHVKGVSDCFRVVAVECWELKDPITSHTHRAIHAPEPPRPSVRDLFCEEY